MACPALSGMPVSRTSLNVVAKNALFGATAPRPTSALLELKRRSTLMVDGALPIICAGAAFARDEIRRRRRRLGLVTPFAVSAQPTACRPAAAAAHQALMEEIVEAALKIALPVVAWLAQIDARVQVCVLVPSGTAIAPPRPGAMLLTNRLDAADDEEASPSISMPPPSSSAVLTFNNVSLSDIVQSTHRMPAPLRATLDLMMLL